MPLKTVSRNTFRILVKVTFQISGIRNSKGYVRGVAFTNEKGFPENYKLATAMAEARSKKGTVQLSFDITEEKAAFAFFHDEKNIRRVEKSLLGIPKNGITFTNWRGLSKPKFSSSLIKITPVHALKIKYF